MRLLVLKSFVFVMFVFIFITVIKQISFIMNMPDDKNACYIWGDSQIYRAIDLSYLNTNSSRKFYSSAQHGAGIYDFLVFSNTIPKNSCVIIPISHTVLVRGKNRDLNVSGFNVSSLLTLYNNNYSAIEIAKIIYKNSKPNKFYNSTNTLYTEEIFSPDKAEPISLFKDIYSKKNSYLTDKIKMYLKCIKILKEKNCTIIVLRLPFHPMLQDIEAKSPIADVLNSFDKSVIENINSKETVEITSKENIFKDYTHLNKKGARLLSKELDRFVNYKRNIVVDVKCY